MIVIQNLEKFIQSTGQSDRQFLSKAGIKPQSLSHWKKGTDPGISNFVSIKNTYKTLNLNWLCTGDGEMTIKKESKVEEPKEEYIHKSNISQKHIELLEYTLQLQKDLIDHLKRELAKT